MSTPEGSAAGSGEASKRKQIPLRVLVVLVAALFIASTALAYELGWQAGASGASGGNGNSAVSYLNLSVVINNTYSAAYGGSGFPQYTPANFTVHRGLVKVTITDQDSVTSWSQCTCEVRGTVGGTETINGTPESYVSPANVAHTFTISSLSINVLSPGQSVVTFELNLDQTGSFTWLCDAPCGANNGYGFPMFTPGFMEGTMTVV